MKRYEESTDVPLPLTDEQVKNVMLYGRCVLCGAPRERFTERREDRQGFKIFEAGLRCSNGHKGW